MYTFERLFCRCDLRLIVLMMLRCKVRKREKNKIETSLVV
jgi:hypothetical protein